jgi:pSer/pThr/pTyr-binding forkhead associated (FHA) protein
VVVGRRSYCDIVIEHSSLSKRHCVLVKTDGLLVIRDLISTNGTKVKGQKIRWAALLPDDRITLGSYKMRVYLGPDEAPGPSELYRARAARGGYGSRSAAPANWSVDVSPAPAAAARGFAGPQGVAAPVAPRVNPSFPEPSALEISIPPSDRGLAKSASRPIDDDEPLIPIVLDDDDEIIDLD